MFQEILPTAIICYYSLPGLDRENTGNKLPNLYKLNDTQTQSYNT